MERIFELFLRRLVKKGDLEVVCPSGRTFRVGDGTGEPCSVEIADGRALLRLILDPELALGELYCDGRAKVAMGDIYTLIFIGMSNMEPWRLPIWLRMLQACRNALRWFAQRNIGARSRRNVAHHYDLSPELYALFLDSDRQYSCAYFEPADIGLEDAQRAKTRHIAAKLALGADDKVLDIGCGWGGLALYLAKYCDAQVKGITLSTEQLAVARRRSQEQGLSRRAVFELKDYRLVDEKFDRIVSVGMFEHVGVGWFETYFKKIAECLSEKGVALVHTIGRTDPPGSTNPWIAKYIFPGGYIPAMSEVLAAVQRTGMIVSDVEVLRLHYAETLKAWRNRFMARREEAIALYDDRFVRMWEFYLAGSEVGFRLGYHVVFQFQLVKKIDALPIVRDYIALAERNLFERENAHGEIRLAGE